MRNAFRKREAHGTEQEDEPGGEANDEAGIRGAGRRRWIQGDAGKVADRMDLMFRITSDAQVDVLCALCGATVDTTMSVTTTRGEAGSRRYKTPNGGIFESHRINHPTETCVRRQREARDAAGAEPGSPGTETRTVWPLDR